MKLNGYKIVCEMFQNKNKYPGNNWVQNHPIASTALGGPLLGAYSQITNPRYHLNRVAKFDEKLKNPNLSPLRRKWLMVHRQAAAEQAQEIIDKRKYK